MVPAVYEGFSEGEEAAEGDSTIDCRCGTVVSAVPLLIGVREGDGTTVTEKISDEIAEGVSLCDINTLSVAREDGRGDSEPEPVTDDVMEEDELLEPRLTHQQ
jgi:hypothetical protein